MSGFSDNHNAWTSNTDEFSNWTSDDGFQSRKKLYPGPLKHMNAKQAILRSCAVDTDPGRLYWSSGKSRVVVRVEKVVKEQPNVKVWSRGLLSMVGN